MFQVPLGLFKNPAMPYMRVGSYLPITVVLALVFVIPHDSSTRLDPDVVGAAGYTMMPTLRRGLRQTDCLIETVKTVSLRRDRGVTHLGQDRIQTGPFDQFLIAQLMFFDKIS